MSMPRRGQRTKERILEEACLVFAEKGYRDATHVEICSRAGANAAAVNYYFSSKEALYRAAFEHLTQMADTLHPLDGGLPPEASPEERLHALILAHLNRMLDPERLGSLHRIHMSEMFDSTGLLKELMARRLARDRQYTLVIIGELLGPQATKREMEWCEMSTISQCFMAAPSPREEGPRRLFGLDVAAPADIAEHILTFSMAGILAIRQQIEAREKPVSPVSRQTTRSRLEHRNAAPKQ
jgi:AcrR family transcriptional regulator